MCSSVVGIFGSEVDVNVSVDVDLSCSGLASLKWTSFVVTRSVDELLYSAKGSISAIEDVVEDIEMSVCEIDCEVNSLRGYIVVWRGSDVVDISDIEVDVIASADIDASSSGLALFREDIVVWKGSDVVDSAGSVDVSVVAVIPGCDKVAEVSVCEIRVDEAVPRDDVDVSIGSEILLNSECELDDGFWRNVVVLSDCEVDVDMSVFKVETGLDVDVSVVFSFDADAVVSILEEVFDVSFCGVYEVSVCGLDVVIFDCSEVDIPVWKVDVDVLKCSEVVCLSNCVETGAAFDSGEDVDEPVRSEDVNVLPASEDVISGMDVNSSCCSKDVFDVLSDDAENDINIFCDVDTKAFVISGWAADELVVLFSCVVGVVWVIWEKLVVSDCSTTG